MEQPLLQKSSVNQDSQLYLQSNYFVKLIWNDVVITADHNHKIIVDGLCGSVSGSQVLAILGASGSGKTTFLDCLAQKELSKGIKFKGTIEVNDVEVHDNSKNLFSYVNQFDVLEPDLTPRETLMYYCKLKRRESVIQQEARVRSIIKALSLENCQNSRIGDSMHKGISGGEKKRVCIGIELLSDSPIIILDEPSTGLDSQTTFELMKMLRRLKKVVILTIHQPASELFDLIDKVMIISHGKQIYFGMKEELFDYFSSAVGLPIPEYYNPFEFLIEVTSKNYMMENEQVLRAFPNLLQQEENRYSAYINSLNEIFQKNKLKLISNEENTENSVVLDVTALKPEPKGVGFFTELYCLFLKFLIISYRNPKYLAFKFIQFNILTIINTIVLYNSMDYSSIGVRNKQGMLFQNTNAVLFNTTGSTILICKFYFYC